MTLRELPAAEWGRLDGMPMAAVCALLMSKQAPARIQVVEDTGLIVGHFGLFPVWHAEAMYIHADYRRHGHVARLLLHGMRDMAIEEGVKGVVTASFDSQVSGYLERLGASPMVGTTYVWPLESV